MNMQEHWEKVYATLPADRVGWYRPHLETSLNWINELGLAKDASVVDVGGGASTLVDDLLDHEYQNITVIDLSQAALSLARDRLGKRAERVEWIQGDITSMTLP